MSRSVSALRGQKCYKTDKTEKLYLCVLHFPVPDYPDELYYVEVPVISNTECEDDYGANQITENMICAGDKVSTDSCQVSLPYNQMLRVHKHHEP